MHLIPDSSLLDPVGNVLRELECVVEVLQKIDPKRLYGDRTTIDGAILALLIVQKRIDDLMKQQAAE